MKNRGVMSCVFGCRLLCDLLEHAHIEHMSVGVLLTVTDPGHPGRQVVVGNHNLQTTHGDPDGFKGHVVVLARAKDEVHLVDPTVFQVNRFWAGTMRIPPTDSLVIHLKQQTSLAVDRTVSVVPGGWTYSYEPAPDIDWRDQPEWVNRDQFRMQDVVRKTFTLGTGITFPPPPGRNEPCPCGSGKKFKRCHGQVEA
jgi:hypothetical protein